MELTTLTKISQIRQSKLTIFMQIISPDHGPEMLANLVEFDAFMQIRSPEIDLTCWRI